MKRRTRKNKVTEAGNEYPSDITLEEVVDLYCDSLASTDDQFEDLVFGQFQDNLEVIIRRSNIGELGQLPNEPAIYFLTDQRQRDVRHPISPYVLYVGQTEDLRRRWNKHHFRQLWRMGFQLRWKEPSDYFFNRDHEEMIYIALLQPPLNIKTGYLSTTTHEERDEFLKILLEGFKGK